MVLFLTCLQQFSLKEHEPMQGNGNKNSSLSESQSIHTHNNVNDNPNEDIYKLFEETANVSETNGIDLFGVELLRNVSTLEAIDGDNSNSEYNHKYGEKTNGGEDDSHVAKNKDKEDDEDEEEDYDLNNDNYDISQNDSKEEGPAPESVSQPVSLMFSFNLLRILYNPLLHFFYIGTLGPLCCFFWCVCLQMSDMRTRPNVGSENQNNNNVPQATPSASSNINDQVSVANSGEAEHDHDQQQQSEMEGIGVASNSTGGASRVGTPRANPSYSRSNDQMIAKQYRDIATLISDLGKSIKSMENLFETMSKSKNSNSDGSNAESNKNQNFSNQEKENLILDSIESQIKLIETKLSHFFDNSDASNINP